MPLASGVIVQDLLSTVVQDHETKFGEAGRRQIPKRTSGFGRSNGSRASRKRLHKQSAGCVGGRFWVISSWVWAGHLGCISQISG